MNETFDLAAFRAKRDAAQAQGNRWSATVFEIKSAYAAGDADLYGADLYGADLYGADLSGANLRGANLRGADLRDADLRDADLRDADLSDADLSGANLRDADLYGADLSGANLRDADLYGAKGIYIAYAPNLSSRGASLLGGIVIEGGKIQLRFWAGCKECVTTEKLLEYVAKTHGENIHSEQYKAAIKFIQSAFKSDMKFKKFDYMLELEANKEKK